MIGLEELRNIGRLRGLNLAQAEKDYLLDLTLSIISKSTKGELIFKGGTCLNKFYKLNRFSEDLDFSQKNPIDIEKLLEKITHDLKLFGIESSLLKKKQPFNSVLITLRTHGPLYTGKSQSLSNVRIDINLKSEVELNPVLRDYRSLYNEVPGFSVLIMDEKEILAEKVRAILTRNKARDLYDLWFLINKSTDINKELIKKKLMYYNLSFDEKEFEKTIDNKKSLWNEELKVLIQTVPDFETVKKDLLKALK